MKGLVVGVLLLVSGCSFFLTRGPGSDFDDRPENCSYSTNAPALDTIFASLHVLMAVTFAAAPGDDLETGAKIGIASTFVVFAGLHLWARFHGVAKIERCREAYRAYQDRRGGPIPDL